jgi:Cu(I)/Ag(I) efflux system protein CusF
MSKRSIAACLGVLALGTVPGALAQHDHAVHVAAAPAAQESATGEIRRVDKAKGRVTIKHGVIKNLGMDPMTMVYQVKDKAVLDKIKAGDKVRFTADEVKGILTVMSIEVVK